MTLSPTPASRVILQSWASTSPRLTSPEVQKPPKGRLRARPAHWRRFRSLGSRGERRDFTPRDSSADPATSSATLAPAESASARGGEGQGTRCPTWHAPPESNGRQKPPLKIRNSLASRRRRLV
ncbi:hypothetical protein MDA_GLEAN10014806 [Myotis davidii]|uniref:Uncharacterized protein n=1 Tax=Myotis davidii TaxID=225400 RepID=L5LQL6_MYODS|nr:hypothetical protein MDA_GLEAN10014806 [Myotis davidii]